MATTTNNNSDDCALLQAALAQVSSTSTSSSSQPLVSPSAPAASAGVCCSDINAWVTAVGANKSLNWEGRITCAANVITDLNLKGLGMTQFPNVSTLASLKTLDVSYNDIRGTLPTFLPLNTALFQVTLSYNELTGSIPASYANFSKVFQIFTADNNCISDFKWPSTANPIIKSENQHTDCLAPGQTGALPSWISTAISNQTPTPPAKPPNYALIIGPIFCSIWVFIAILLGIYYHIYMMKGYRERMLANKLKSNGEQTRLTPVPYNTARAAGGSWNAHASSITQNNQPESAFLVSTTTPQTHQPQLQQQQHTPPQSLQPQQPLQSFANSRGAYSTTPTSSMLQPTYQNAFPVGIATSGSNTFNQPEFPIAPTYVGASAYQVSVHSSESMHSSQGNESALRAPPRQPGQFYRNAMLQQPHLTTDSAPSPASPPSSLSGAGEAPLSSTSHHYPSPEELQAIEQLIRNKQGVSPGPGPAHVVAVMPVGVEAWNSDQVRAFLLNIPGVNIETVEVLQGFGIDTGAKLISLNAPLLSSMDVPRDVWSSILLAVTDLKKQGAARK